MLQIINKGEKSPFLFIVHKITQVHTDTLYIHTILYTNIHK
nr:MAG TPA: hypothetical protein [Caudoviricetes sp.]DAY39874.1 MAG TPA: hypothetical protein [Caudoviricetes sp.]